jgi:hypothetical protein
VIEFKAAENGVISNIVNDYYKNDKIIYQPELKTKFIIINSDDSLWPIINRSICFKLIKNEILKKVINIVGPKYTEAYMLIYEDTIMSYILFKVANSYYLMKEIGYYYSKQDKKELKIKTKCICSKNKIEGSFDEIQFLNFLFEKTQNNKIERKMLCHEILTINHYFNITKINHSDSLCLSKIIEKMIRCRYLSKKEKEYLLDIYNNLKKKQIV